MNWRRKLFFWQINNNSIANLNMNINYYFKKTLKHFRVATSVVYAVRAFTMPRFGANALDLNPSDARILNIYFKNNRIRTYIVIDTRVNCYWVVSFSTRFLWKMFNISCVKELFAKQHSPDYLRVIITPSLFAIYFKYFDLRLLLQFYTCVLRFVLFECVANIILFIWETFVKNVFFNKSIWPFFVCDYHCIKQYTKK